MTPAELPFQFMACTISVPIKQALKVFFPSSCGGDISISCCTIMREILQT